MTKFTREDYELAAKAAGYRIATGQEGSPIVAAIGDDVRDWNPPEDDGDALRLAVRLGIDLLFTPEDVEAVATQHAQELDGEMLSPWACESWTLKPQDTCAATRRAIFRAAIAIGKAMP